MAQEVGVRSVQDLKQFGSDLKRLSEQLSNAFHAAEKKMNRVCEGWNDTSNQKFMTEFQKDAKQIRPYVFCLKRRFCHNVHLGFHHSTKPARAHYFFGKV